MKKTINVILALALTTLLAGCGVRFGIENRNNNGHNGGFNFGDSANSGEKVNISEPMNEITKLDIRIDVSNVKINYYDGPDVEISGTLSKYSRGMRTEKSSNKLIIIEESKNGKKIREDYSSNLTIKIPRNFNGDFELNFGVGECEVNDLELNNVTIENGVGEISLEEISFNKLNLESGVGSTTLTTNKRTGEITIKGGIGETDVSLGDINGDLKFDGGVGSATIKVPVNAPISISSRSGLGEARIKAKTSNDAKYHFDINVGIGEVEIRN